MAALGVSFFFWHDSFMNPTRLIQAFQAERDASIAAGELAAFYLEVLLSSFERHSLRGHDRNGVQAYRHARDLVWRVRRRYKEQVSRENCTYTALQDWAEQQCYWHSMKDGPLPLDFPDHQE